MKKKINLSGLILLTAVCMFASAATVRADEAVMQSAKSKIMIGVGNSAENLVIDWGDGQTSAMSDGVQSSDYSGIRNFTHSYTDGKTHTITVTCLNLTSLACNSNELTSLSVNNCPNLEDLLCYENRLTSLNINNYPNLEFLSCGDNQLTSLNIKDCPKLYKLVCRTNQLKNLDVSECTSLQLLDCHDNQLTSLNIGASVHTLYCYENQLTDLHINASFMSILSCGKNRLRSLTFKKPCRLQSSLYCNDNLLTNLDISNMRINTLHCSNNLLTNLNMANTVIEEIDCSYNKLTSLDASSTFYLRKLNINGCRQLKELICDVDNVEISSEGCYNLSITAPVPEGTITVNMRNSSGGDITVVTPEDFSDGFYIKGDNFYGKNYKFKTVGEKAGIVGIKSANVPKSAWVEKVAVKPGYAYIARKVESVKSGKYGNNITVSIKFVQIYVVKEITSAEDKNKGGVIGAEVQYRVVPYDYD